MTFARAAIIVADSVTALDARHAGAVLVSGSHGGLVAASYAAAAGVRAAIFNDAGDGLDDAGTAGLGTLDALGIAAVAVSNRSSRIGDGRDTLACGVVSRVNAIASTRGITTGMACRTAAERLRDGPVPRPAPAGAPAQERRFLLRASSAGRPAVVAIDSVGLVDPGDAGQVLIVGSHGGLHGGDPSTALGVDAFAAFFHDAGRGKEDAGVSRLPVLERRGMAAAAVDYRTARIGDARSLWATGIVSCVNAPLRRYAVVPGMAVAACVERLLAEPQST